MICGANGYHDRMGHRRLESNELALWAIDEKLSVISAVSDSRTQDPLVMSAVAEACWWIASLDEHLQDAHKSRYSSARDADPRGFPILGLRWARHRHTHDLLTTSTGDVQPFLSDEPGVMFHISSPYRWRSVDSMNLKGKSATLVPDQKQRYIDALQGRPVKGSLVGALSWLNEASAAFA